MMRLDLKTISVTALCALVTVCTAAQDTSPGYARVPASVDGIGKSYMGREIASVMGWQGAGWLERGNRAQDERPDLLLRELSLQPGMWVADVGAGTGYHTWEYARQVGSHGRVYAVDVQPQMLALLEREMTQRGITNVVPVLGTVRDIRLPAGAVDLAIMVDVYHELEYPRELLASIVRALKPSARVVFVEYRAEDPAMPIKPLHKMSEAQVRREAAAQGLAWERTITALPMQHAIVFRKRLLADP